MWLVSVFALGPIWNRTEHTGRRPRPLWQTAVICRILATIDAKRRLYTNLFQYDLFISSAFFDDWGIVGGKSWAAGLKTVLVRNIRLPFAILAVLIVVLAGCSGSGPQGWDVKGGITDPDGSTPYVAVKVTPRIAKVLAKAAPRLVGEFRDRRRPADLRFGIGDILSVTIFEAAAGGLFIADVATNRAGNFITIPNQAVDDQGNISIPYAGNIRAAGRTKVEVQNSVVEALKNRAIEPQVVVTVITQQTSLVTVAGDVRNPSRIPAFAAGERILDTITRAGGTLAPGTDEWVILERGGRRALAPYGALLYESANNIWTHPGDTIYLYREPQTFLAFGAFGALNARSRLGLGAFLLLRRSPRPEASTMAPPIQRRYFSIEVKPAKSWKQWVTTPRNFRDQLFQSSITSTSETHPPTS